MKTLTAISLLALSLNAFSAVVQDCKVENNVVQNVVVLKPEGTAAIQKILDTKDSAEMKQNLIKRILYIETLSIGDGISVCELAVSKYKVSEEKCLKVMKSSDLMSAIMEESDPSETTSLECIIGVTAKLSMLFSM
ncbi:MAG: hypothetical protein H7336_01970 [Bacteriovorax sp.]|nr:hypothetical protein [Bacteriovorax sp.]